jgi:hypothetical protein
LVAVAALILERVMPSGDSERLWTGRIRKRIERAVAAGDLECLPNREFLVGDIAAWAQLVQWRGQRPDASFADLPANMNTAFALKQRAKNIRIDVEYGASSPESLDEAHRVIQQQANLLNVFHRDVNRKVDERRRLQQQGGKKGARARYGKAR